MQRSWKSATATVLTVILISCGGGGGGGGGGGIPMLPAATTSSVAIAPTTPARTSEGGNAEASPLSPADSVVTGPESPTAAPYTTFALLPYKALIVSLSNANPAPGEKLDVRSINAIKNLPGASARDMAYDSKRDRLYIAMGGKIMMVAKASQASGDVATSEFVVLASGLGSYSTMVLDAERDELWLGGPVFDQGALVKISNISAAYGQIRTLESIRPEEKTQPVASYQIWHIRSPLLNRFAVDPVRSLIYASDGLGGVFDLASLTPARKDAATGDPIYESAVAWNNAPVRRFFNGTNVFASDVALDAARDRLYFLNSVGRQIVTIDGASAPTTPTTFTRLALPKETISIALDSKNDRLYVGGMDNDAYIFNAASTIGTGTTVPGTNVFGVAEDPPGKGLVLGISLP